MLEAFLTDNFQFTAHGWEHLVSVILFMLLGILYIKLNKGLADRKQRKIAFWLGILILASQLFKTFIRLYLGNFDHREDLPLHLCNMMPFLIPWALLFKWRAVWAVLFLWIMAGTFQSIFTPTLVHSFPHYEYFRYWLVHVGLVILAILPIFIWDWRLQKKDILNGFIGINILALLMYFINLGLDANYMYLIAKPKGDGTLYDVLGPWPYYILSLEVVAILLFSILYLPFHFFQPNTQED